MSASMHESQPLEAAQSSALSCAEVDYSLPRWEGFRVYDPDGRVATVGCVLYARELDRLDFLAVRIGFLRRRVAAVEADSVDCIDPANRQLTIRSRVAPSWRADHASDVRDFPPRGEVHE